ncbi:Glycosyltransferase involved in cell wall bisynthesis [Soonwooa buanensis]|uniref:Glycosyltransferase involved in cell wall bisynthesis n=1 Tax=Soonwooa buanensis TaxID=619805 RepID=A0A1T5FIS9_9FLAO|nr:glycosyltransferase family 4 protein [Soonwooa buanensis]SKB96008.1 Glycosyltransferase involved in cell wall bisynthesis [Soonwooa buanensis]
MKIVFNTDQIHLHGGIEKVMATKVNFWANLPDVEVFIVTTEQHNLPPRYPLDERVRLVDFGVNYDRGTSYFSFENLKKAWQHYKRQKQLFADLQPDVIISPNFNFDHYWLPFIKQKAKLIKERHGSRFYEVTQRKNISFIKKLRFKINDWIEKKYDAIVVLNPDEASYVKTNNAVVIPNPVKISNLLADISAKKVVAAGRISPVKNFADLIKAWGFVYQEFPDWQLDIYGEDYLGTQTKLEQQIEEAGLQNVIHFKGSTENMLELMSQYSIYAMTSETECFPMVLLEALSIGLPIVSYDCPNGPRHIIDNGEDGILVKHKNVEALATELKTMMRNPAERQRIQKLAKHNYLHFTTTEVMKQWQTLLNLPNV